MPNQDKARQAVKTQDKVDKVATKQLRARSRVVSRAVSRAVKAVKADLLVKKESKDPFKPLSY